MTKYPSNLQRKDLNENHVRLHFSISIQEKQGEELNVSPPTLFKVRLKDGSLFVFGFEKTKLLLDEQLQSFQQRRISYVSSGLYVDETQSCEDCFKSWKDVTEGKLIETNLKVTDQDGEERPADMEYMGIWLSKFDFLTMGRHSLRSFNNENWLHLWQSRHRMSKENHDKVKDYLASTHISFEVEQSHRHNLELLLDKRETKDDKNHTIYYSDVNVVVRYEYKDPDRLTHGRTSDIYRYKIDQYGLDDNVFKVIDALYAAGLPEEPEEVRNVLRHLMMTHPLTFN